MFIDRDVCSNGLDDIVEIQRDNGGMSKYSYCRANTFTSSLCSLGYRSKTRQSVITLHFILHALLFK